MVDSGRKTTMHTSHRRCYRSSHRTPANRRHRVRKRYLSACSPTEVRRHRHRPLVDGIAQAAKPRIPVCVSSKSQSTPNCAEDRYGLRSRHCDRGDRASLAPRTLLRVGFSCSPGGGCSSAPRITGTSRSCSLDGRRMDWHFKVDWDGGHVKFSLQRPGGWSSMWL